MLSKEKFKTTFESVFLIIIFSFCGLAFGEYILQPLLKPIFASVILMAWISMLAFGFIYKESYIFKCSKNSKRSIYIGEQLIYFILIIINCEVLVGAVYT